MWMTIVILYEIENKESIKIDIKYVTAGVITLSSCMITYANTRWTMRYVLINVYPHIFGQTIRVKHGKICIIWK